MLPHTPPSDSRFLDLALLTIMFSKFGLAASLASAAVFIAGIQGAQCKATDLSRANFWFVL